MENDNLLPANKANGFLNKIKMFFKSIFNKPAELVEAATDDSNIPKNESDFMENLKEKTDIESAFEKQTIEYLVQSIDEDPKILNSLTIEQLESVNEYYAEKIEKIDQEIEKLKKQ